MRTATSPAMCTDHFGAIVAGAYIRNGRHDTANHIAGTLRRRHAAQNPESAHQAFFLTTSRGDKVVLLCDQTGEAARNDVAQALNVDPRFVYGDCTPIAEKARRYVMDRSDNKFFLALDLNQIRELLAGEHQIKSFKRKDK